MRPDDSGRTATHRDSLRNTKRGVPGDHGGVSPSKSPRVALGVCRYTVRTKGVPQFGRARVVEVYDRLGAFPAEAPHGGTDERHAGRPHPAHLDAELADAAVAQGVVDADGSADGVEQPVELHRVGQHAAGDGLVEQRAHGVLLPLGPVDVAARQVVALADVGQRLRRRPGG